MYSADNHLSYGLHFTMVNKCNFTGENKEREKLYLHDNKKTLSVDSSTHPLVQ